MRKFLCAAGVLTVPFIATMTGAVSPPQVVSAPHGVSDGSRPPVVSGVGRPMAQAPVAAGAPNRLDPASYQGTLTRYCVPCHNGKVPTPSSAPLILDTADLANPGADAATWERVVRKLAVGAMPPPGFPTPGAGELDAFRSALVAGLDAAAARTPNPGRYVLHRLNRTEYANAIRDLVGVSIDVADLLPSDGGDFGFDNIATALPTSPLLLERYLTAAMRVADLAVGDPGTEPGMATYEISTVVTQDQHVEGLPLGTRGGVLVRHHFPADGEYVFSGRLLDTVAEGLSGVEGHETPHTFVVTLDGRQIFSAQVGGTEDHKAQKANLSVPREEFDRRMTSPRIPVTAGAHEVGFTWVERPMPRQDAWEPTLRATLEAHNPSGLPRLRTGNIEGPYNVAATGATAARSRLLTCTPASAADERSCAAEILSTVARRAFRRPVTDADLAAPLAFYRDARAEGGAFDDGIRAGLARILASPAFLFREEHDPPALPAGTAHPVTDLELASRLSFFLWSSLPDDELLDLARAGRLREPGVLEAQVRRLIADPRADALMTGFAGQWLQLRNLDKVTPDLLMFPDFDDNLRQAFRRETELLFTTVVREDLSALELLDADFTFVNERLARHYGIRGVYGSRFRRVPVTDQNRRGLLGHGSILSLTSVATRTSPVLRGKYIISNLLNTPPLPPPANVPELEESEPADRPSTVREQLERHRANPVCASCHRNIDPVGFALENYDAIGQWRDATKAGLPIDAAGVLADGTPIDGPAALRKALLARPEVFVGTITEKLMTYALGRGLEPIDMPVVRSVVRAAAARDYAMQSIVLGIVRSAPFQMRTTLRNATQAVRQTGRESGTVTTAARAAAKE